MIKPIYIKEVNVNGDAIDAENSGMTFVDWGRVIGIASSSGIGNAYVEISINDAEHLSVWLTRFLNGE